MKFNHDYAAAAETRNPRRPVSLWVAFALATSLAIVSTCIQVALDISLMFVAVTAWSAALVTALFLLWNPIWGEGTPTGIKRRSAGLSLTETTVWLVIFIAFVSFIVNTGNTTADQTKSITAFLEIQKVITAAQNYRNAFENNRAYTGISIAKLEKYGVGDMGTGANANVFGKTVAIAISGTDAKLTYDTPTHEICASLLARYTDGTKYASGLSAASCKDAGGSATTLEDLELIIE